MQEAVLERTGHVKVMRREKGNGADRRQSRRFHGPPVGPWTTRPRSVLATGTGNPPATCTKKATETAKRLNTSTAEGNDINGNSPAVFVAKDARHIPGDARQKPFKYASAANRHSVNENSTTAKSHCAHMRHAILPLANVLLAPITPTQQNKSWSEAAVVSD